MKKNIDSPHKGLHTDNSLLEQPKGTTRFTLNTVSETEEGDQTFSANEESNETCHALTAGYIPLGQVYIGNGDTVIFSVSDGETLSEIGIADKDCNYTVHVNADLGFTLANPIDATYRLRRGCERILYWTDPKPRNYNLDKPESFQDEFSAFQANKFDLFRRYETVPNFDSIEVEEGGTLDSGSYNFAIQYLDQDLTPTEWITSTETIIIYNDSFERDYGDIRGSTNVVQNYQNFGPTNKSIKLNLSSLDEDFLLYRLAIIEATSGTGQVSAVKFSQALSTETTSFTFTGSNEEAVGTVEEIQAFATIINKADHIEQIENRLILGNVVGNEINFCLLQKYASKIKADLTLKEVDLNTLETNNPKHPTAHFDSVGYMPGEIYSFGIVYLFEDNTTSPVYHIPGRNTSYVSDMSDDNVLEDTNYVDNSPCSNIDYWGEDSEGTSLEGTAVRHHRFPRRGEISEPLITADSSEVVYTNYFIKITWTGTIGGGYTEDDVGFTIDYKISGIDANPPITDAFAVTTYNGSSLTLVYKVGEISPTDIVVTETDGASGLGNSFAVASETYKGGDIDYTSNIFGIDFTEIEKPAIEETGGLETIGYYIVRNEREEENQTILDNGILLPVLEGEFYTGHGLLNVSESEQAPRKKDIYAILNPEHKFLNKEALATSRIINEGTYSETAAENEIHSVVIDDVAPGTSYNADVHQGADGDGFSLHTLNSIQDHTYLATPENDVAADSSEILDLFYLKALRSKTIEDSTSSPKEIFNISADNNIGIVALDHDYNFPAATQSEKPYIVLKRDLSNPYSNFRNLPYYKENQNPVLFGVGDSSTNIYNGDSYISPIRYTSTVFHDIRLADRAEKSGLWNTIIGVFSILVGIVLIATIVGAVAGLMAIGFGITQLATGIEAGVVANVYQDLYEQGLKNTAQDEVTNSTFLYGNPDDELQWSVNTIKDIFIESKVNMNWRKGATIGITDFLNPFSRIATNNDTLLYQKGPENILDHYALNKLTVLDTENDSGRLYKGYPQAEIYELNLDYLRRNKEKIFFHLGIEYDCCSDCREKFPHRLHYSEQSFQEELSDNYKFFLPNNYVDIEGETGVITDLFRIQNNLYVHTEEALWHLPQNIQERVTGDIISFIGTGSFFSIPPRKIVDDSKSSAGTRHKWATTKTRHGVFFVSEEDRKVYQFDGNTLNPISNLGMAHWFKENIGLEAKTSYYSTNQRNYPYDNNPTNPIGLGYISVYDTEKERMIFSKIDFSLSEEIESNDDYELIYYDGDVLIFDEFQATIDSFESSGYTYRGMIEGEMKFYRSSDGASAVQGGDVVVDHIRYDSSWTLSYSLKDQTWVSWHSYLPNFYFYTQENFYSLLKGNSNTWRHNLKGNYQTFYNTYYPHIVEFVASSQKLENTIWDDVALHTTAKEFISDENEYLDKRYVTFNKGVFYNRRQISGLLNLIVKDEQSSDASYLKEQIVNELDNILIDNNEGIWTLNNFRDIRVDYDSPMFNKDKNDLQASYYIDKEINTNVIDADKSWLELESFRDKYLVVRLIFDNFDNVRLITNYSVESETLSVR